MLLPTILPRANSYSFFLVAVTDVTNSGSDVPKATIVKEIKRSLTPNSRVKETVASTTKLLPNIIQTIPIIVKMIE